MWTPPSIAQSNRTPNHHDRIESSDPHDQEDKFVDGIAWADLVYRNVDCCINVKEAAGEGLYGSGGSHFEDSSLEKREDLCVCLYLEEVRAKVDYGYEVKSELAKRLTSNKSILPQFPRNTVKEESKRGSRQGTI